MAKSSGEYDKQENIGRLARLLNNRVSDVSGVAGRLFRFQNHRAATRPDLDPAAQNGHLLDGAIFVRLALQSTAWSKSESIKLRDASKFGAAENDQTIIDSDRSRLPDRSQSLCGRQDDRRNDREHAGRQTAPPDRGSERWKCSKA